MIIEKNLIEMETAVNGSFEVYMDVSAGNSEYSVRIERFVAIQLLRESARNEKENTAFSILCDGSPVIHITPSSS